LILNDIIFFFAKWRRKMNCTQDCRGNGHNDPITADSENFAGIIKLDSYSFMESKYLSVGSD
jgi:hypothetical protein